MTKYSSQKQKRADLWTTVSATTSNRPRDHNQSIRSIYSVNSFIPSPYDVEMNEWAGALQFGTFNKRRMCPVLEVRVRVQQLLWLRRSSMQFGFAVIFSWENFCPHAPAPFTTLASCRSWLKITARTSESRRRLVWSPSALHSPHHR